jgi:signal transduction histidine kinase
MITRTLRSRVITLAGAGVFVSAAAFSLLSRQSLLELDGILHAERVRTGAAASAAIARDLNADLQTLEGAITAPRSQPPAAATRLLRLADGFCYVDAAGATVACEPEEIRRRLDPHAIAAAIRQAKVTGRPVVSAFARQADGTADAVAVVPDNVPDSMPPEDYRAAVAVIAAAGPRMRERIPAGAALTLETPSDAGAAAPVLGSPWILQVFASARDGDPVATFRGRSLWFAPTLAALAALMAWGIVLSVQRPLQGLTRAAERIAEGDFSLPIAGGDDEIGRLGTALEHMRGELRRSRDAAVRANAELERRVEDRTAQLQHLVRKLISAQEEERRRVARELHDETSQILTALGLALHAGADPGELIERLHGGVHRLIVNLRPPALDDLGLAAAIEGLAESELRRAGIAARAELVELQDARLDPAMEIAIFRIVQESILNIVRHAGATTVLLQGGLTADGLWIEIEDDGAGFDPANVKADTGTLRGIGILGMRERAELLGGRLTIDSAPGQGTRIRIDAPALAREARAS